MIDYEHESSDQCVGIFGDSGTGKSSVLKLMAGLMHCTKKQLSVNNCDYGHLPAHKNPCVYVGAEAVLFEHLSVANNTLIASQKGGFAQQNTLSFEFIVDSCGISHLLEQKPHQLSSGENQRVAFARALMSGKPIILLDEAFSALDWPNRLKMLALVNQLKKNTALQFILVSHSLKELAQCCEHICVLKEGQVIAKGDLQSMLSTLIMQQNVAGVFSSISARWCNFDAADKVSKWVLDDYNQQKAPQHQYLFSHAKAANSVSEHRRFNIDANQVTLATHNTGTSSMLNCLEGCIVGIDGLQDRVLVSIDVQGQVLRSTISRRSAKLMNIQLGDNIYALFKAL